jgi:hypothetical protein
MCVCVCECVVIGQFTINVMWVWKLSSFIEMEECTQCSPQTSNVFKLYFLSQKHWYPKNIFPVKIDLVWYAAFVHAGL